MKPDYFYTFAGFRVNSTIPLPGLCPHLDTKEPPEITVFVREEWEPSRPGLFKPLQHGFELTVASVGRFITYDTGEICVTRFHGASNEAICFFLLSWVFELFFHRNGRLPLHASAVDVRGGGMAFVGNSRAGKSTMAALLAERGYRILSDDVCVLDIASDGSVLAFPGLQQLRLLPDAVQALGISGHTGCLGPLFLQKHSVNVNALPGAAPLPLQHVYALMVSTQQKRIEIEPVHGFDALRVVLEHVHHPQLVDAMQLSEQVFRLGVATASMAKVFRIRRPLDYGRTDELIDRLEEIWHATEPKNGPGTPSRWIEV